MVAVVVGIQLSTVSSTNVIVSKELGHSDYPCIYHSNEKDAAFFVGILLHICRLVLRMYNDVLEYRNQKL